jgi:hypothetical protein
MMDGHEGTHRPKRHAALRSLGASLSKCNAVGSSAESELMGQPTPRNTDAFGSLNGSTRDATIRLRAWLARMVRRKTKMRKSLAILLTTVGLLGLVIFLVVAGFLGPSDRVLSSPTASSSSVDQSRSSTAASWGKTSASRAHAAQMRLPYPKTVHLSQIVSTRSSVAAVF